MDKSIEVDFTEMEHKLKFYIDKGRIALGSQVKEEPLITVKPDASLMKPLKKVTTYMGSFIAVDCSTRTLKRANNWGIYLMRASCASVRERTVDWSYSERICTVVGDSHVRRSYLQDFRIELESQVALQMLKEQLSKPYHVHGDVRSMYLLLDGGGYFGGERKFRVSLYEECKKNGVRLLAISKNSPSMHDEKGRDLVATTYTMTSHPIWVYYPVRKADKDRSLYGDIAIVKLCAESQHVFRCDIMDYLTQQDIVELLSPLTSVCEDPRCIGYPISLYLAHEFSAPSNSMLFSYYDKIEDKLNEVGLLEALRREERSCSFADEIHGVKHAFEWEWWDDQY
ncbi:MAG: hypothetical protein NT043_00140 [Candidatus Bathyarchaeota archaeon]|nr:hypothetical protein [Candidatus Bathyarchaeota archaeon]